MPKSTPSCGRAPKISVVLRRKLSSFLRMRPLQSLSLKARLTSIFHPLRRKHCAATRASPALCPFPAKTMHVPGFGKNLRTARATPAPALSIKASTSTPRAKAAFSASRICAEVRIGDSIQTSSSFGFALDLDAIDFDAFFFFYDLGVE